MHIAVFASGVGSNFKNIIDTVKNLENTKIQVLITNRECKAIDFAKKENIPFSIIKKEDLKNKTSLFSTADIFSEKLLNVTKQYNIDLILLAGYMEILPPKFIDEYPLRILNIHPSLLPKYKGKNVLQRVWENGEKFSGVSIHYVNDSLDAGKIIEQKKLKIAENLDVFKRETHALEHFLFSKTLKSFIKKKALVISKCLLGVNTRYDASDKKEIRAIKFIENYKGNIYFVCPETEIGMDTPRKPIKSRLELPPLAKLNVKNLIEKLQEYDFIEFLLKENSPSCGVFKQEGEIYTQAIARFKETNKKIIFITENDL